MIIGVSIMVLIVSSVIGAPEDEPIHAVSGGSAQVNVLALPFVPTVVVAAARALPFGGADIDPRASGDPGCAAVSEFKHGALQLVERNHCALMEKDNIPEVWKCRSKFVRDCVGDFPSIGIRPSDTHQDPTRQITSLERRRQNPSAAFAVFSGV